MGIFINLLISKSVTQEEWEKVYEETLHLADVLQLSERQTVDCQGIPTLCLVRTRERKITYGWNSEQIRVGWAADGDYETMHTAEEYFLPRDLVKENTILPDAGDAILGALPFYLNHYDSENKKFDSCYHLWGRKTQGEPYHIPLLSIACMIESRLGKKAFIYGDITRGQCLNAIELANAHLANPIHLPDRCNMDQLWKRINELPFDEKEQLAIFERFYLGKQDPEFGAYIRSHYSEKACTEYWVEQFQDNLIKTVGFDQQINKYLLWGFDLEQLCRLVNYYDRDGNLCMEYFIKRIMDAKLHLSVKNCDDLLEIDQDDPEPYGVQYLMAQFAFSRARNKKVDRYIPIEDIRTALKNVLSDMCDTDLFIDDYLKKEAEEVSIQIPRGEMDKEEWNAACEQDITEVFRQTMELKRESLKSQFQNYDISMMEDLVYYEIGDQIKPSIHECLKQSFLFYHSLIHQDEYKELMTKSATERCRWLTEYNNSILIRDKDWDKIYTNIKESTSAFERYYPMNCVKLNSYDQVFMIVGIILNDELYQYCKEITADELSK